MMQSIEELTIPSQEEWESLKSPPKIALSLSSLVIAMVLLAVNAYTLYSSQHFDDSVRLSFFALIATALLLNSLTIIISVIAAIWRRQTIIFFVASSLFMCTCVFDLAAAVFYLSKTNQSSVIVCAPICAPVMTFILLPIVAEVFLFEFR